MTFRTVGGFADITLPTHTSVVILDFDNTCYLYNPCHESALSAVHAWFEQNFGTCVMWYDYYSIAQKEVKQRIPTHGASHSRILYFKTLLENLRLDNTVTHCLTMEKIYWETFQAKMQIVPSLLDFLELCRERGTKVVVVSDLTTAIQCEKICHLGIASYVNFLITSEEIGVEKPNPRCFAMALEKTSAQPEKALVIGDNYERDILGAEKLGIPAILIAHD
jgi:HAD superfamily hydrolase (TIGR01549 family)